MRERYSIEVNDESVEIYGELTIEETFDFLSFFERKGYKSVILGTENSTLHMLKRDQKEEIVEERIKDLKDEVQDYKRSYKIEQERHEETKDKLKSIEQLIKDLTVEANNKRERILKENEELKKSQLLYNTYHKLACDPPGTEIKFPFDWTYPKQEPIPNCCSTPERQEQYEQLVQLKNDFPHIPIPSPSDFYINPDPTKE